MFDEETTPRKGFRLVDGVRRAKEHPRDFEVPVRSDRESLDVGDFAKVGFSFGGEDTSVTIFGHHPLPLAGELMWVEITSVGKNRYEGLLRNKPNTEYLRSQISWGDLIEFGERNVLEIRRASQPTKGTDK